MKTLLFQFFLSWGVIGLVMRYGESVRVAVMLWFIVSVLLLMCQAIPKEEEP